MELAEIRNELEKTAQQIKDFRGSLDLDSMEVRIAELEDQMLDPNFWNDQQAAQKVINESNVYKETHQAFHALEEEQESMEISLELLKEEADEDLQEELEKDIKAYMATISEFELKLMLSDPYDKNNAILELHPGAGGTESQDWGSMLLRMYQRWSEKKGFKVEMLDYQAGDEAGIKSVTLLIKGHNAYGYLKAEKGVHRLVRISPFDSSGRRHTSFVSVDVMPELDDDIEIEVRTEDLKIDTYRATGAGGQHINTTDSAVRMTHIPSGIVVTCQSERSQLKNREQAMKMLKTKLYQKEQEEKERELAEIRGEQKEIGWGSQIRSYVFHPYSMVKDHRTNYETGNIQAVMDGDLDDFINAYLRSRIG
ncbi:peptide chain release factor 2 [Listeria monocytogenes]|uniref:peptide chain release factor 2 n=1 Tax=Listeria monocytogenes TaxID=1639 RepID=UPI00112EE3A9|nr:peptide chain release factor 2 [Listeria monocytogenes]EAF0456368.1 peptide chain release factor 2 [Listeria monocytogenes]EAG3411371.1 peptide chain release factor 2 [Listeria monocytogenes]EGY4461369.1 peptide chain release factor 2 [Listeria monocytogenes]